MNRVNRIPTIDDYLETPVCPFRKTGGARSIIKQKYDSERPLVTVFTAVLNRKETLPQTIMSVFSQSYPNIEYVIVDGGSTDGTLEVIKQHNEKIDLWISEPDCGQTDANNKAISLAQGEIVFWLASDDWIGPDFIEVAVKKFLSSGADFVFGNMAMYRDGDLVCIYKGNKNYSESLMSGNPCFNFPSMVIKKESFKKIGLFDTAYKFTNDYEWLLRFHERGGKGYYDDLLIVHRRTGGVGERHLFQGMLEQLSILKQHRLPMAKAISTYLNCFVRRGIGYFAKLFLPEIIHKKLKFVICRRKQWKSQKLL